MVKLLDLLTLEMMILGSALLCLLGIALVKPVRPDFWSIWGLGFITLLWMLRQRSRMQVEEKHPYCKEDRKDRKKRGICV